MVLKQTVRSIISLQFLYVTLSFGFVQQQRCTFDTTRRQLLQRSIAPLNLNDKINDDTGSSIDDLTIKDGSSSYESSASLIKGIVSSLTSLINSIFQPTAQDNITPSTTISSSSLYTTTNDTAVPPTSPEELLTRIQNEYTTNNYLWTGNIDTSSFVSNCTFTDPTLSFVGVDKYITNVGNLVPVVNYLLGKEQYSKSDLLNITLNEKEQYVETRWNMVGTFNTLFWKPKIDVIGRTKFWYNEEDYDVGDGRKIYQVYFYDEMWEIPAGLALLQLITPAGTVPNTKRTRA